MGRSGGGGGGECGGGDGGGEGGGGEGGGEGEGGDGGGEGGGGEGGEGDGGGDGGGDDGSSGGSTTLGGGGLSFIRSFLQVHWHVPSSCSAMGVRLPWPGTLLPGRGTTLLPGTTLVLYKRRCRGMLVSLKL